MSSKYVVHRQACEDAKINCRKRQTLLCVLLQLVRSLQAQNLPEEGEGSGSVSLKKVFQFLHQVSAPLLFPVDITLSIWVH